MDLIKLVREILHLSGKQKSIVTPHIPDQQLLMTTQWATNQVIVVLISWSSELTITRLSVNESYVS